MLSRPLKDRDPNSLHDMDFWSDAGKSVYRPKYTISELLGRSGFSYFPGHVCTEVQSLGGNVELRFSDDRTASARRAILAAGPIGSARIALRSIGADDASAPLLCNRNHWIACVNLPRLGKDSNEPRHSLSQLTAIQVPRDRPNDRIVAHFYSYRSLLLYRLAEQMPFHPWVSVALARMLMSSLTFVNVHFADKSSGKAEIRWAPGRGLEIVRASEDGLLSQDLAEQRRLIRNLRRIGVWPLKTAVPALGSSIHYAGTLPFSQTPKRLSAKPTGELWALPGVYVADASTWLYLPAKGLTFTIMAGARRVAREASNGIR